MTITASDIETAARRLEGVVRRTELTELRRLSEASGARVLLKREDLQPVRSYKLRGAHNLMSQLSEEERALGVVCASAGNHGQGVAHACAQLGIRGRIFCPTTTPRQKRDRMRSLGGEWVELVFVGNTYDEAAAAAVAEAAVTGAVKVHAFDDERTIAGQATVAVEIVEQLGRAPDVLLVPVGGGGLLSGCLTYLRERWPGTRVIGVEPVGAASMQAALWAGRPTQLESIDTFADGVAVSKAGENTLPIIQRYGCEWATVPEGQICSEMLDLYQIDGVIAEPAGALAVAALRDQVEVSAGQTVVAIVSGGNNDVSRYAEIVERSLVFEGRKHYFLVSFPQEPGALRGFLDNVLGPEDDITLFEYTKRSNREQGPALVGIELGDPATLDVLMQRIEVCGLQVEKLDPASPFYRLMV
ncbi:threonine dehydratase [Propionibacterium sp. oral taxon 192 str. F0372]|uniref:threonine ammonia-lyase IlvA n=1 Tax=Propionibacterium sp. oral taxon 192 TaxID=671222 RepID=UPI000352B3F2|nr:threonine ammonia-lyase IlvA [Propionibacterium sp. oral taxon 192]EPH02393.1 threonine dehydratase [Propionibacterium sp. oral taxon 192 str. F0372]